jgi:hypothetical protein
METFAEFFDNFLKERTDPVEDSDKKAPGDKKGECLKENTEVAKVSYTVL